MKMKILARFDKYKTQEGRLKFAESLINLGLVFIGSAMLGLFQLLAQGIGKPRWLQLLAWSVSLLLGLKLRDEGLEIYDQQHHVQQESP